MMLFSLVIHSIVHAFLKFLTIICIGIALVAAFASVRVFIFTCQMSEHNNNLKSFDTDSSKLYSTLARFGSIIISTCLWNDYLHFCCCFIIRHNLSEEQVNY